MIANHTFGSWKSFATDDCLPSAILIRCHSCFTALTPFIHIKVKTLEICCGFVLPNEYRSVKIYSMEEEFNYFIQTVNTSRRETYGVMPVLNLHPVNVIHIFFEKEWHALDKNSLTDGLWLCDSFTKSRRHHTTDCV